VEFQRETISLRAPARMVVLPCEKVDTGIVGLVSSYSTLWSSAARVRSALGFGVTPMGGWLDGCR
jgi:hypothetical protein